MERILRTAWVLLLALPAAPVWGAGDCEQLLVKADSAYQTGRFVEALASLQECLDSNPPPASSVPVLALQAKVQLAMDDRDAATATISRLLRIDGRYAYDPLRDPPLFLRLVDALRQEDTTFKISSVSKTPESLREAPANVTVITAEQIERRGYRDLDALFDDIPGFNVSRSNGVTYSNIYTRGYRSDETNRTMFMVDGVEENDIWSNTFYLSRQFAVSTIERVEVIYGPASTMYGANAFAGVVNIVTKAPESFLAEDQNLGVEAHLTSGSFGTNAFETTVSGRIAGGGLSWMISGRFFESDEPDLSDSEFWDYDPAVYETAAMATSYRQHLGFTPSGGNTIDERIARDCTRNMVVDPVCVAAVRSSTYFNITPGGIALTEAGLQRAIALDQSALNQELGGAPIGFSDPTENWLIYGKFQLSNLVVGFQTWRTREGGTPWYTDQLRPGGDNGNLWTPEQSWFYLKYSKNFRSDVSVELFSQYREHTLDGTDTALFRLNNYARGSLSIANLAQERAPSWDPTYFYLLNTQLRNELKVFYHPSQRFNVVAGLELRNGSLQGNYTLSTEPNASETGAPGSEIPGGNRFRATDMGAFIQASYKPFERFKLVAGGRVDDNRVRETLGYGTVFNPRLAAVYLLEDWTFKAIYGESFLDASNFVKFATDPGVRDLSNPTLEPETAKNLELNVAWQVSEDFTVDLVGFDSEFSGAVQQVSGVPCGPPICDRPTTTSQFQAVGALTIRGLQLGSSLRYRNADFYGNYTYLDPFNEQKNSRVGDIASHQVNFGANVEFRDRLNANVRLSYVGTKDTGAGTDVSTNPLDEIDSYLVAHASLTYRDIFANTSLQLTVNNLLDEDYYHPGVRGADGVDLASRLRQPGRAAYLRLSWTY